MTDSNSQMLSIPMLEALQLAWYHATVCKCGALNKGSRVYLFPFLVDPGACPDSNYPAHCTLHAAPDSYNCSIPHVPHCNGAALTA